MSTTVETNQPTRRRARRKVLTDRMIADLPRKDRPYFHPDPEMAKFGVRVQPDGPPHAF